MNKQQLQSYQQALLELEAELVEVLGLAAEANEKVELDQARFGRVSRGSALLDQAMSEAAVARDQQRLRAVRRALKRIADDSYGYCLDCDEPIAEQRLAVAPETELCLECQSLLERRQG